jgi:hypothetical protein
MRVSKNSVMASHRLKARAQDVAPRDVVKVDHLGLDYDLLVPLWEIAVLRVLETFRVSARLLASIWILLWLWRLWRLCRLLLRRGTGTAWSSHRAAKVDHLWLMLEFCGEFEQIRGRDADRAVVAQWMDADLRRGHQLFVQHQRHGPSRVIHHGEWRHGTLLHRELLLQDCAIGEAKAGTSGTEQLGQLLHVYLAVVRHRQQEEPCLLILDKQILREAARK